MAQEVGSQFKLNPWHHIFSLKSCLEWSLSTDSRTNPNHCQGVIPKLEKQLKIRNKRTVFLILFLYLTSFIYSPFIQLSFPFYIGDTDCPFDFYSRIFSISEKFYNTILPIEMWVFSHLCTFPLLVLSLTYTYVHQHSCFLLVIPPHRYVCKSVCICVRTSTHNRNQVFVITGVLGLPFM